MNFPIFMLFFRIYFLCGCSEIKAIDAYIAKVDEELTDILDEAGFAEPNDTVKEISSLEEETAEILKAQTNIFDKKLKKIKSSEEITAMVEEFEAEDVTADKISEIYHEEFNTIMDGVTARKDEPFQLPGADSVLYTPMFPRDPELPASESVNCHCIHRGIVNENVC